MTTIAAGKVQPIDEIVGEDRYLSIRMIVDIVNANKETERRKLHHRSVCEYGPNPHSENKGQSKEHMLWHYGMAHRRTRKARKYRFCGILTQAISTRSMKLDSAPCVELLKRVTSLELQYVEGYKSQ